MPRSLSPPPTAGAVSARAFPCSTTSYDSAGRDTNAGYAYDAQGDITTTPSADAGGSGNLTAAYNANDMLASQTQGSQSESWTLDPTLGRYGTFAQGGVTSTSHYSDGGNSPAWTAGSDGTWTRNVTDFNGNLAAEVTASGVTLELPDLHGDILATATTSTTATGPTGTYTYTEFGTPETGTPGTYGWLGANQISGSALGGQFLMGARAYNANTGRFQQTDPVFGGSANAYDYALQNPVTNSDLTGNFVSSYCQAVPWEAYRRYCKYFISESTVQAVLHFNIWATAIGTLCGALGGDAVGSFCLGAVSGYLLSYAAFSTHNGRRGEILTVYQARLVTYWWFGHWDSPWNAYWATLGGWN